MLKSQIKGSISGANGFLLSALVLAIAFVATGCSQAGPMASGGGMFADEPAFVDEFDPGWGESQTAWEVATWEQNGNQMDPERCRENGKGQIVQTVLGGGEPYRGGSMQTVEEFGYGRWVARVKPSSVPGVLNSIFADDWDNKKTEEKNDGTKFEIDIEFLTYTFGDGKGKVHIAVHKQGHKNMFYDDVPLDFDPSADYVLAGFDILPDCIIWHMNGYEISRFDRPEDIEFPPGCEFFFNSWTSPNPNWINGPNEQSADYLIDWVKFYPLIEQK